MEITEITELSKSRYMIILDREISFALYKGEVRRYRLKPGAEISEAVYRELMEEVLPKRAKMRCMNLLTVRDYTETQLRAKLKTGGYPQTVIDSAIDYVKSYGYVGDEYYARKYIETYWERKSRRKLEQELRQKGISPEVTARVYEEVADLEGEDPELMQIGKLLKKRGYQGENTGREERMKLAAYLARKGYSVEKIRNCMGNFEEYDD